MNKRFILQEKPKSSVIDENNETDESLTYKTWVKSSPVPKSSPAPKIKRIPKISNKAAKSTKSKHKRIEMPALQCNGISKKTGMPCKNMTKNPNGYCHHH